MSTSNWQHHRRIDSTTHSKEHALDEREFELLVEGASKIDGYRGLEARFIVFVAGRLGLRAGEITHLRESWLDRREQLIEIPAHQPCESGRDGGRCGHCRQLISQCAEVNGLSFDEIAEHWWRPKTEAAVRGVPYDWSPRAQLAIERFFERFDRFELSQTGVGRRVDRAATLAPELEPDDVYPHALRSTAATYQVSRGLEAHPLCSMMGWANLSTAEVYIARSDENTRRAVRAVHSR